MVSLSDGIFVHETHTQHSADFVASMLLADLAGVEVELPDWLPRHYLARPPSKPRTFRSDTSQNAV